LDHPVYLWAGLDQCQEQECFVSCTVIVWEFALLVVMLMLVWVLLWVTRSETHSIPFSSRENDGEFTPTNYFVSTNSNTSPSLRLCCIDYAGILSKWTGGKLLSYSSEVSSYALNLHSTWRILSDDYSTIWLKIIPWSVQNLEQKFQALPSSHILRVGSFFKAAPCRSSLYRWVQIVDTRHVR